MTSLTQKLTNNKEECKQTTWRFNSYLADRDRAN